MAPGREAEPTSRAAHHESAQTMKRPDTPFPRHWRYYMALKIAIIAAAAALALKYFGVW